MTSNRRTLLAVIMGAALALFLTVESCGEPEPDLPRPARSQVPADTVDVPAPADEDNNDVIIPPVEPDATEEVALECPVCPDCPEATPAVFEFTEADLEGCFEGYDFPFLLCPVL